MTTHSLALKLPHWVLETHLRQVLFGNGYFKYIEKETGVKVDATLGPFDIVYLLQPTNARYDIRYAQDFLLDLTTKAIESTERLGP